MNINKKKMVFACMLFMLFIIRLDVFGQQKIQISSGNYTLGEVLKQLADQSGLTFQYDASTIELQKKIFFSFQGSIQEALTQLARTASINYRLHGQTVTIRPSEKVQIAGTVVDEQQQPIAFASVQLYGTNLSKQTDHQGRFSFYIDFPVQTTHTLVIKHVAKTGEELKITANTPHINKLHITLKDFTLTLNEVEVSSRQQGELSNSSIYYDREAIEMTQAFSLTDVLNTLPGRTIQGPELNYLQNLNLRIANGQFDMYANTKDQFLNNNSNGIAFIVDGFRKSNDANMQNTSIGRDGITGSLVNNTRDRGTANPNYDNPFSGLDLRDIPADNIENIEVISGVASAKYGEITDGAIIINTMAGKSPYLYRVRFNGNTTNTSLSKGFGLGERWGALNISFNYLNSNQEPSNKLKIYNRINGSTMWTRQFGTSIRNTLNLSYSTRIDNRKQDPDDFALNHMYTKSRSFSFSNRTNIQFNQTFFQSATLGVSFDKGYQETYNQIWFNQGFQRPVADKDTTGTYEGYFIPGTYLGKEQIIGEPINYSANFNLDAIASGNKTAHNLSFGANLSGAANQGMGIVVDPNEQRFVSVGNKGNRAFQYNQLPNLLTLGFYAEDRFNVALGAKMLTFQTGIRGDIQNGAFSLQPRINSSIALNKHFSLKAAYGISSKAPSMTYRYPLPVYFDIPLLNISTGREATSLYLVHTERILPDNSHLKPAKSQQIELGASYRRGDFNSSLFVYYKKNWDGFYGSANYTQLRLPVYRYIDNGPDQKPSYYATDSARLYTNLSNTQVNNNARVDNFGLEWFINLPKIQTIQTSFNLTNSLTFSKTRNAGNRMINIADSLLVQNAEYLYAIYPTEHNENLSAMSKITSDTHIPRLGFIISLSLDLYWTRTRRTLASSDEPIAVVDRQMQYIPMPDFDRNNPDTKYLLYNNAVRSSEVDQPFVYGNFSMRIAKEIKKKIRFSVNMYNPLNIRPQYYETRYNNGVETRIFKQLNSAPVVSAELSIKF